MNYYIADLHIGHENVIKFDNRPFSNLNEMNDTIIDNWNSTVHANDTVYVLGDFVWGKESEWADWVAPLAGNKVLISGNHDSKEFSNTTRKLFVDIKPYKEISDSGRHVILNHYAIPFHNKACQQNVWMLYGHVHITREYTFLENFRAQIKANCRKEGHAKGNFINVGCMMPWMNYTPRTLDDIIEKEKTWYENNPNAFSKEI